MTATVQTLALELYTALISDTRINGETFYKLRPGSPDWMSDAIQAAHEGMLPDDMRYSMIRDVALRMTEAEDDEITDAHEAVDGLVDVYTARLTAWLASSLARVAYVDQALEDNGGTLGKETSLANLLMWGQYGEFREIWDSLAASLASEAAARAAA